MEKYKKDAEGNFLLDENGNKIPLTSEELEVDKKVQEAIKPIVEELKIVRQERDLTKKLLDDLNKNPEPKDGEDEDLSKVKKVVEEILGEKESSNAKANKQAAFEKYCIDNKEFHPDNDTTGLKRDALSKKFSMFNTESLKTFDEFYSIIGEAHKLLGGSGNNLNVSKEIKNPYSNIPTNNGSANVVDVELSSEEEKILKTSGWSKEKYLKLKEKDPHYVKSLFRHIV